MTDLAVLVALVIWIYVVNIERGLGDRVKIKIHIILNSLAELFSLLTVKLDFLYVIILYS